MSLRALVCLVSLGFSALAGPVTAQEPAKDAPPPAPPKIETVKVARAPMRVEVALTSALEPEDRAEIVLRPEAWAQLVIEKAPEPGARVKAGDALITFDAAKLEDEIHDAKHALETSSLGLEQARLEHEIAEKTAELDLTAALRSRKQATENLQHYLEVDAPLNERQHRHSLDQSRFSLEYSQEELNQLEKMYKADDMTEETEEIILKRARRDVESSRYYLDVTTARADRALRVELPRQKENMTESTTRTVMASQKTEASAERQSRLRKLGLAKQEVEHKRLAQKLEKLSRDRELAVVKSPRDGIVYLGRFSRGKWVDAPQLAESLRKGGAVQPNQVFLTVADPRVGSLRVEVPEKELQGVEPGAVAIVSPTARPSLKLLARVDRVAPGPTLPGIFEARVVLDRSTEIPAWLLPGMECSVKIVAHSSPQALVIPEGSLFFEDSAIESEPHVFVAHGGQKPEKRIVKLGRRAGGKVEILSGLAEGDEVTTQKPQSN